MSRKIRSPTWRQRSPAPVFAALGDETRLSLVKRLCGGPPRSITDLAAGSSLTRHAITKHIRVLERAGIVHDVREGRRSLIQFDPEPIEEVKGYLDLVSAQWDETLSRLQAFVENR